jgi:hypothetical protein
MPTKAIAGAPGQAGKTEDLAGAELTEYTAREAAWTAGADDRKAAEEREWRDSELVDTDKYGLSDMTMSAAMTTYRQSLRDMPADAGFPNSHTRPTRPAGE